MTAKIGDRAYHKRHHDFESFDRITLEVVPRYKTSGLSGDEWRQHIEITFLFKGIPVHTWACHDMQAAIMLLGSEWIKAQEPIPDAVIKIEEDTCDQPSCKEPPTHRYTLKSVFARDGSRLDPADTHLVYFRKFCEKHGTRGDCGREDSDANYVKEPM